MLPEEDRIRIQHMLDAAREALRYADGCTRSDLDADTMRLRAVVKCVEIVGEAGSRVSEETAARLPAIPWKVIRAMRNRLIHAYFDINVDVVWQTVQHDLPRLERALSEVLGADVP